MDREVPYLRNRIFIISKLQSWRPFAVKIAFKYVIRVCLAKKKY